MKKSLYLLTTAILINIVNFNTPYCMDKNENKININKGNLDETKLEQDTFFEKIYHKYVWAETKEEKQEQIKKLCEYLFGKNGENLETILLQSNMSEIESYFVNNMLYGNYKQVRKYLSTQSDKFLSNIHSALEKEYSEHGHTVDIIDPIKGIINDIELMKNLRIDISFQEMYCEYKNAFRHSDYHMQQNKILQKFCEGLFGKSGENLETILFNSNISYRELYNIRDMLCDNYRYVIEYFKNNNKLFDNISNILDGFKDSDNNVIVEIINKIKDIKVMKNLKMDISFKEIEHICRDAKTKKEKQEPMEKFCKYLFGKNGKNLETILLNMSIDELNAIDDTLIHDRRTHKLIIKYLPIQSKEFVSNIHNVLNNIVSMKNYEWNCITRTANVIKDTLVMIKLNMDTSFGEIEGMYYNAKTETEKQEPMEKFCKYLFGKNSENLETILFNVSEDELDAIQCTLIRDRATYKLIRKYLRKQSKEFVSNIHNALNSIVNSNDINSMENFKKDSIIKIINIIKDHVVMIKLNMDSSFKEMESMYYDAKTEREKKQELTEKFCKYLFGDNSKNLETILSEMSERELIAISDMLKENKDRIQQYLIKCEVNDNNNDLCNNILNIINANNNKNPLIIGIKNKIKDIIKYCINKYKEIKQIKK